MDNEEEKLITNLGQRITGMVVSWSKVKDGEQTQEDAKQEELRNQNVEALLELSATKLNVVAAALCNAFNLLPEKFKDESSDEEQAALARARVFMIDLLGNCLSYSWDFLKKRFKNVEGSDEKEKIMLKQKEELILPPPLEDPLALKILDICCKFLLAANPPPHQPMELKEKAGRLLFQLSASNFEEPVFSKISANIAWPDETTTPINLIEYLNLNSNRLSSLLVTITKAVDAGVFKKDNSRLLLARVLTKAIWNWIDHYPMEFVSLCQSSTRLGGEPDKLFDVFVGWSGKNKKGYFWEVQTMLLVLCPDIMLKVALHKESSKETAAKEKFMNTLNKALKGKLADVSAVCYVDICKASTFVSKTDMSALRYIVPAIETELKERLFNPQVLFKTSGGNEVELMTDCLIASFRLSPRKVVNSLFTDFLKPNYPPIFKLVLVNTLQRIVDEGASLPWNPTIQDVYSGMAHQLRALFQDYEQQARGNYNELVKQKDRRAKDQLEKLLKDIEILTRLILLFNSDPNLPLYPSSKSAAADLEDTRNLLTGLCSMASLFSQPELSAAASKALLQLHRPEYIARWCTQNVLSGFWDISSAVNICIANVLTDRKDLRITDINHFISLLKQILVYRNAFLARIHKGAAEEDNNKPVKVGDTNSRALASTQLEVALLIHLCSSEPEIVTKVENCFGLLCDEIDTVGASESENSIAVNYGIYRKLANSSVLLTGRAAQQRAIRVELRRIRQTKGNYTAWDQVHQRWTALTQSILAAYAEDLKKRAPKGGKSVAPPAPVVAPEKMVEWNHFSGFLAAAGGVSLGEEMVKVEQTTRRDKTETTVKVTDSFISTLLKLIVSDHDVIRETTTELAGSTLSPAVYSVLFHLMHRKVNKFFGKEGQIKYKPRATTFVDQAISIIKHIMELPPDSHTADDLALLVDFEDLVSHLVKYVSGLVVKDNPAMGLRIKAKMCGCLEAIMQKHLFISFNNEFPFRQSLVEIIMEWISDFSAKPKYKASGFEGISEEKKKEAEKGVQDVDIAAVKAISALLRGLSLPKDEEAETSTLKKYFTFFTNIIGRAKSDNPDAQVSQKADFAIGALSNLLSANIDSALEYFVTMGYHEDLETRAAFLKVLSNILNQGTEFDSLSHEGDKYDKLVELLLEPKLEVVLALSSVIQITEADEVAQLLVRLFEANEKTMDLLKKAIKQEVSKTETENTLFRRNSMATKLLAAYSKMIGTRTLKDILTPVLQNLIANPPSLELDPQKLPPGQDRGKNIENVTNVASAFLKAILDYLPAMPLPFREICHYMKAQVGKRFPGAEHAAIGGFVMLRFICPAIVAPDGFGLVQPIALSADLRRGLVLTTKVLQNLANKVMFTKEPHMEEMNTFLKEMMPTIDRLFDDLAVVPETGAPVIPLHVSEEQREEDLANLHYHLSNSLDKLHKVLSAEGKKGKKGSSNVFLRLTAVLSQLGPAPEPSRNTQFGAGNQQVASKKGGTNNNLHAGFMDEHAKMDTSKIEEKKLFFKQGMTKDKQPVFYYIARRLDKSFTQDQLIFHIMKTLQPELGKPFVVVIDCTLFSKEYEITPAWISRFRQVAPSFENLVHLFFINANYEFKKYSKKIAKLVSRARPKMVFLASLKELFQYIPEKDIGLPTSTLAVEKDVKASFSPVQKLMPYNNQKEVIIRISNDMFAVVTVKQHNIFGKRIPLVDLFHISSIFEINISVDTNEFVIKYDKDASKSMTFRTPASEQIILALKASKARWNLSKTEETAKRSFRAADVPGTLLNMALLNLGNPSAVLRVEAYNLLAALCSSFNLSVQTSLWETSGLCIPKNTNNFIVSLSKKLATNNSNMTLEFLMEALHGIEKIKANLPGKQLSLNYITHWLPNLRLFCAPSNKPDFAANVEKTKEIFHLLIEFTIRETSMTGPAIQSQVWEVIGGVPEILDIAIECLLERANDKKTGGISSTASSVIGDIFVSMASQNPRLVSGKIIAGLMKVLAQTHGIKERLEDHLKWKEIETYLRILLMLSFENLLYVSQYLPELFHIVLLLFATGPPLVRATVHGLLINIVHALYTTMVSSQNKMQSLRLLLSELDQQKTRVVFGLGGLSISAFSKPSEKAMSLEAAAPMAIGTVETVAMSLLSILNYCSPTGSCLGSAWHSRFLSLATRVAYTPNAALQPRAIIALGVLCNSSSLVTDDLMSQVLRTLLEVLQAGHKLDQDLPLSLIICLTRLFEHLPSRSKYFKPMFWLSMVLLEIDEPALFAVAIGLLEVVLKALDNHDCFADGIISYCMAAREECGLEEALAKADQVTGINFKTSFSFAVAGHLLKGLRKPATKTATARVLSTFVDIAAKKAIGNNMLGYLAALLPIKGDDMENMRQLLSGEAGSPHQYLFREEMLPDTMNGALLFTLLVTILKSSDSEHEQQFIYESLKEGVLAMPEAFPVVYEVLIPKMTYVIQNSQNPQIIDACLCIMKSMFSGEMEATTSKKRLNKDYLSAKIGFHGLIDCDTFAKTSSNKTTDVLVKIGCQLLDQILRLKG